MSEVLCGPAKAVVPITVLGLCAAFATEVTRGAVLVSNLDGATSQSIALQATGFPGKIGLHTIGISATSFTTGPQPFLISKITVPVLGGTITPQVSISADAGGVPAATPSYTFPFTSAAMTGGVATYLGEFTAVPSTRYWLEVGGLAVTVGGAWPSAGTFLTLGATAAPASTAAYGWSVGTAVLASTLQYSAASYSLGPNPEGNSPWDRLLYGSGSSGGQYFVLTYTGQTAWTNVASGSLMFSMQGLPTSLVPEPSGSGVATAVILAGATRRRRRVAGAGPAST